MAGRIPQQFIDDLLTRLDIVDVIDASVPLKKAGANYKACCPFHNEKSPSFTVSQEKQFFHCFGCGKHGTAIGFLMEHERLSFPEAIESLAQIAGVEIPYEDYSKEQKTEQSQSQAILSVNKQASEIYQQCLRENKAAVDYLKGRGLSGKTAANFDIGFIPDSWDTLIKVLGKDEKSKQLLKIAGLISENDQGKQYDKFRHRIMFPIRNRKGDVIAFGGRVISKDNDPKYLNSPETPVFHKGQALYGVYELRKYAKDIPYVLVVEGYMDVVALAEQDINTAVATLGTATTTEHIRQLLRIDNRIIFCFDGDKAGKQAAWRALNNALPALNDNAQLSFLFLPDGEDPDSLVKKEGKIQFEARLQQAMPLAEYLFNGVSIGIDVSQLSGKAQMANQALPLIKQVTAPILKELLYTKLEDKVHLDRNKLQQLSPTQGNTNQSHTKPEKHTPYDTSGTVPEYNRQPKTQLLKTDKVTLAISALLVKPELADKVSNYEKIQTLEIKGIQFLCEMIDVIRSTPTISAQSLLQRYVGTKYQSRLEELQANFMMMTRADEVLEQEFVDAIQSFEAKAHEERYQYLLRKLNNKSISDTEKAELKSSYGD